MDIGLLKVHDGKWKMDFEEMDMIYKKLIRVYDQFVWIRVINRLPYIAAE